VTKTANGVRSLGVLAAPGRRALVRDPVMATIVVTTLIAALLRAYQLTRPGFLLGVIEYDDGADFGSAIRLVHGALPYRDFIMVQPPGITLLMTPVAFAAKGLGSAGALAIGRVLTALASTAGVLLAGLLVRHRGVLATMITCGTLAVFPDSIAAAKTVLLEPWLVLFCLLGALALFDRDRLAASGRRLAVAGLAFGFAGAVKVWAILPVLAVLVLAARRPRRALLFAAGVAVGFLVPVLPFAALAPRTFYSSVVVAQLVRVDLVRIPLIQRLTDMTGLVHVPSPVLVWTVTVLIAALSIGSCAVAARLTGRQPAPLEWFVLGMFVLAVIAFLWPADFYYHYAAFLAPFLGMAIGLPTARALAALPASRPRAGTEPGTAPAGQRFPRLARLAAHAQAASWLTTRTALWTAAAALAVFMVAQAGSESTMATAVPASTLASARHLIRPGACVVSDQVSYAMAVDRFTSSDPRCSPMVDGIGTDYALATGHNGLTGAESSPQLRAIWTSAFRAAQYVWLTGMSDRRIPWTPQLRSYFLSHFQPLTDGPDWIYLRTAGPSG
jgi:hypothetical protein